jgi:ectoine hydroxylase-related dioxygenase (phytanoyl-CoA dioxygenase family)
MKNEAYINFLTKGFAVYKNFFSAEEVEDLLKTFKEIHGDSTGTHIEGLHNHQKYWSIITNKKILDIAKTLSNDPDIFYLYNSQATLSKKDNNLWSTHEWHRDSACRLFGIGPDWDKDEIYKVLRIGIYLSANANSGLNVIAESHNRKYTISSLLRLLQYRLKGSTFKPVIMLRSFLSKFIGKNIKTNKGDMIVFLANLYHSGIPTDKERAALFLSYGPNNKHSKNYVNYYMKHRKGFEFKDEKTQIEFIHTVKENGSYFPLPENKDEVEGFSVPLIDRQDTL